MEEVVLLTLMATFTLLAAVCSILFNRLKLPALIGYLVAGIIIANTIPVGEEWELVVSILSDIGLVMLMFSIGMEIDISKVRTTGIFAIKIAVVQLPLLVIGGMVLGPMLGFTFVQSITLGAIISGSSTAVVLAVLKSQGILDDKNIELLVLITIMEDIGQVIILSMITPLLAGSSMDVDSLLILIISILAFMIISLFIGLKFVSKIVNWVSNNVSKEVLVISAVGLAFGMALLATQVGLSMAIGAFLMGMMISPCKSCEEINHRIEPMKDLFMAMFFISVGMEISVDVILDNIPMIIAIYLIFAILKASTVSLGYWLCASDGKIGFISAVSLAAMGEFAFIIAKEAYDYSVFTESMYTSVIGAALVSMVTLPFLTRYADRIWTSASKNMPAPVKRVGRFMNSTRDDIYSGLDSSSKRSKVAFNKGMAHAYFNIVVIAAIEIFFYWISDPVSVWLCDAYGGTEFFWKIIMVVLNFFALLFPTSRLIVNTKFISRAILSSCSQIARVSGKGDAERFYNTILRANTITVMLAIDSLIILIVPNNLGIMENLVCFAITLVIFVFVYRKARKDMNAPLLVSCECKSCEESVEENQSETTPVGDDVSSSKEDDGSEVSSEDVDVTHTEEDAAPEPVVSEQKED